MTNHPQNIDAEGIRVEYWEYGNPQGIPLVLLHGFPDSPAAWGGVVDLLNLSELRIIVPCLRGYGNSVVQQEDLLSGQMAALTSDLLNLMDALNIQTFHLAGHDWGAGIAYAACVLAPERVRSLTALASRYVAWHGGSLPPAQVRGYWYQFFFQQKAAETMLSDHRVEFCRELWKTWSPTYLFSDETFAAAAAAWDHPQFVPIVLSYYRTREGNAPGKPAYAVRQALLDCKPLPKIVVPTVFIQGDADGCDLWQGADGQEAYFASYQRILLPEVGHFPHRENAEAVAAAISEQLRKAH